MACRGTNLFYFRSQHISPTRRITHTNSNMERLLMLKASGICSYHSVLKTIYVNILVYRVQWTWESKLHTPKYTTLPQISCVAYWMKYIWYSVRGEYNRRGIRHLFATAKTASGGTIHYIANPWQNQWLSSTLNHALNFLAFATHSKAEISVIWNFHCVVRKWSLSKYFYNARRWLSVKAETCCII
jgi:hypothetical protein